MISGITRLLTLAALLTVCFGTLTGGVRPDNVAQIRMAGEIVMITRNSPTTYYEDRTGPTGYEYELAKAFADHLGVELKVKVAENLNDVFSTLENGGAHFAAAGLAQTPDRDRWVRFSEPYMQISEQVIYRRGGIKPEQVTDLTRGQLVVSEGSSHSERLRIWQATQVPELSWSESSDLEVSDLLQMVASGNIDFTVVDSNEFRVLQAYFPNLAVAFDLSEKQNISWAFEYSRDDSLFNAASEFFNAEESINLMANLAERYYGHLDKLDYVGARRFLSQTEKKLGTYKADFEKAAELHQIDWRLLAAVGYQESHWNPQARSFTGVRGLMMLTRNTARELGIKNRLDPQQSIMGGSQYLAKLRDRLENVQEPDRTWMALAAYNVGYGHLTDARKITELTGGNPDLWIDVKESLPLLSQKRYYRYTRHGFARGQEPVDYVQNIRRYYDVLVWNEEREQHQEFPEEGDPSMQLSSSLVTVIPPLL
ncbi:MAG: membrane-bound lytic murein transglycosylase MltF [Oceanospirillaceae bacterium]|uniref:membrane-bound lytic murein transglycosylase MltF n=1 Tax=unclassified Thalassolituus TaxID=2624967 RepID=UPI000C4687E0|nr:MULTISPECIES: membrane-bound lytic murein transglycosylase MltF [unclassified Thalassolituus]MAS24472.1 membrane-bound lytic murein transglycosylase MltF [Oceanospirillaceae bacterium]MBL34536.1 membrane-bound lytic murein transglycosylase MltF [Oceanospirillaceae bacterium]MBS54207.1 membrane-bound lytic murein transglycosylase MltF [Oceanospirillaceae bacterium]